LTIHPHLTRKDQTLRLFPRFGEAPRHQFEVETLRLRHAGAYRVSTRREEFLPEPNNPCAFLRSF
jgi:hypothetical protein